MARGKIAKLAPAGLAAGGVIAGHVAGYMLAIPDATARARFLTETGHEHFLSISLVAGMLAAASIATIAFRAYEATRRRDPVKQRSFLQTVVRFASLQVALYFLLEAQERFFGRVPIQSLLHDRAFATGLVLQVVTGALTAAVARFIVKAVTAVAHALAQRRVALQASRIARVCISEWSFQSLLLAGASRPRGPPKLISVHRQSLLGG